MWRRVNGQFERIFTFKKVNRPKLKQMPSKNPLGKNESMLPLNPLDINWGTKRVTSFKTIGLETGTVPLKLCSLIVIIEVVVKTAATLATRV